MTFHLKSPSGHVTVVVGHVAMAQLAAKGWVLVEWVWA
jgi:hypothetical protein